MSTRIVMTTGQMALRIVVGCVALLLPAGASAQSAIAGQVTDTTGAVLPGVTVEAASPALIEGARVGVTDGQGRYDIEALRPGTYKVTFTMPGFSTMVRDGIELVTNFTAPISVQMKVGGVEESITVSGQSPLVDVQRTVAQKVLTRDVLDSLPTGRTPWGVGMTMPGMQATTPTPDVGGLGAQQATLTIHGSSGSDQLLEIDGMNIQCNGSGATCVYLDDGAFQEVTYETIGGTAESLASGVTVNMIPKDGGNIFKGTGLALYSNNHLYTSNYSDALKQQGLLEPGAMKRLWDYDASLGGPLMKDTLWFFYSSRFWGNHKLYADTFNEPGIPRQGQNLYTNSMRSHLIRLTGQVNRNNKVAGSYNRLPRVRDAISDTSGNILPGDAPDAMLKSETVTPYVTQAKWTSTLSNRILLEGGFSYNHYTWQAGYPDSTPRGAISKQDTVRGMRWNAGVYQSLSLGDNKHVVGKVSYVTGSHTLKGGVEYSRAWSGGGSSVHGDLYQQYANGVPFQVQVWNTPIDSGYVNTNPSLIGMFVQDAWTFRRFTVNAGLRYDYSHESVLAQTAAAGTFVPERSFAAIDNLPTWTNWSPRVGVAYDVFGNAKTALKFSVGRYIAQAGTNLASKYNPLTRQSDLRTWTDSNHDDIAQVNEIGPSRNSRFGLAAGTTTPDPGLKRGYNLLYNVAVDHQLLPRVSVSAAYFHRRFHNLTWINNLLTTFADYTLIQIPDPRGNGQLVPVYNLAALKVGQVQNVDLNSDRNTTTYDGYDVSVSARFGQGGHLTTGMASGKTLNQTCQVSDPNSLLFCDQTQYGLPFRTQYKLAGSYPLPWGISAGAVVQRLPGNARTISYVVTRTQVPQLTVSSVTLPLNEPGSLYLPGLNQLDLRFSKTIKYRAARIQPQLGLFNLTNSATVLSQNNTFGPALNNVQSILDGRVVRFGVQVDF